jgi:hypothetical protein
MNEYEFKAGRRPCNFGRRGNFERQGELGPLPFDTQNRSASDPPMTIEAEKDKNIP